MFREFDRTISSKVHMYSLDVDSIELEYRMTLTRNCFIDSINKLLTITSPILSQTVDMIMKVKDSRFNKSSIIVNEDSCRLKYLLATRYIYDGIKLVASYERFRDLCNIRPDCIRLKSRLSFIIGSWKYDFTRVINVKNLDDVDKYKSMLFNSSYQIINKESLIEFINSCDSTIISSYEFEIELIDKYNIECLYNSDPFNVFDDAYRSILLCKSMCTKVSTMCSIVQNMF